jgi:hypothetical protein
VWRPQRKDVLFVIGLVGIALEEARVFGAPSETLLLLFAAMIGLPLVLRADEQRRDDPPSTNGPTIGPDSSVGSELPP